jgi:predicted HTH domain antitoxin
MSKVQVQLELPESLARRIDPSGADVGRRLLALALLRLVQDGEISSGKAAEILGVPRVDFWRLMYEHRIPFFDLTEEEFLEDLRSAEAALPPEAG